MTTELLTWHPVSESLPDADITVLCWCEPGGEWFSGWLDGSRWLDAASGGRLEGVTFWCEPVGPAAALAAQPAQPVAWVPRAHTDSGQIKAGDWCWEDAANNPCEPMNRSIWEAHPVYAAQPAQAETLARREVDELLRKEFERGRAYGITLVHDSLPVTAQTEQPLFQIEITGGMGAKLIFNEPHHLLPGQRFDCYPVESQP